VFGASSSKPMQLTTTLQAGVIGMFEKRLKELNPNLRNITYDISDLYEWVETLVRLVLSTTV
jgi:hypothetical protein